MHNYGLRGELLTWLKFTLSSKQLWGFILDPSCKYCLYWRTVTLSIVPPQFLQNWETEKDINYHHMWDDFLLISYWKISFGNNWKWIRCRNLHQLRVLTGNLPAIKTMARYVRQETFSFDGLQMFSGYTLHSLLWRLAFGVAHVCSLETSV